jgi:iron(III) transport system substrate-binding protein
MHISRWLGAAVLTLVLGLGCQPGAAPPTSRTQPAAGAPPGAEAPGAEWDQIVAAGKREGRLLVSTNPGHRAFMEHAIPVFQQEYGIEIEVVWLNGRDTAERLLAEHGAGQVRMDVAVGGDSNLYVLPRDGVLQPFTVPNAAHVSDKLRGAVGADNTYYPMMLNVYALLVNTNEIPPDRVPKRLADILDPYFRGKIVLHNPGTSGGGNSWMSAAHETPGIGRPFLEKLAQQDLIIVQDPAGVEAMVARGERALGVPAGGRSIITQPGAPLRWVIPEEGVAFSIQNISIPKLAPHPNAARVWANFVLSKQAQEWWFQYGNYTPTRGDVELDRPEFNLANLTLLGGRGNRPPEETQHWLSVGKDIFSQ